MDKGLLTKTVGRVMLALVAVLLMAPAPAGAYTILADMGSPRAIEMADNIVSWQTEAGGWDKNIDFSLTPWTPGQPKSTQMSRGVEVGTFDNGATIDEMRFIALVYQATGLERFKESFERALDFILNAQYPSGGWPQVYPARGGYWDHVTFNDNAMVRVMDMIQHILAGGAYSFVDPSYLPRLEEAFDKGIDFILKAQIVVDGRLTAWCAQHDPVTYEPRGGRSYEHPSISGSESVGIVRLLMSLPDPSEEVRRAIFSALQWFEESQLSDGRWARFYEIGTNRPIFSGRDGIIKYDIMEIEQERREGYSWYSSSASGLLSEVRISGYMKSLYDSLSEHPTPFLQFVQPRQGSRSTVSGVVPIDVEVATKPGVDLQRVAIEVDGQPIYVGSRAPEPGEAVLETRVLAEGPHDVSLVVTYGDGRTMERTLSIGVRNWWTMEQQFQPPQDSGWFGVIDYLRASARTEGWAYETGDSEQFFGDVDRLTRASATEESLTWETPNLASVAATVYAKDLDDVRRGLELAISSDGTTWRSLPFSLELAQAGDVWSQAIIQLELPGVVNANLFRLTLRDSVPADGVQIGRLVMKGFDSSHE